MQLFLYDLFIFLNFAAFCIAAADKHMAGRLRVPFWVSVFAFGGCGSALACFLVRHRTKSGGASLALVLGAAQLFLLFRLVL